MAQAPAGWAPAPEAQAQGTPAGWAAAPETTAAPAPRAPVAARGTKGTPPYISDENARLIGGMAGSALVGGATEGLGLIPEATAGAGLLVRGGLGLLRAAAPVAGAGAGGATVAAAQGAPSGEVGQAGLEQAGLEAGGQAVAWPIKAIGKRLLAHPVAQAAAGALEKGRQAINDQLDLVLNKAEAAVRGTRTAVARVGTESAEKVRLAKAGVGTAQEATDQATATAAGKWPGARAAAPGEPRMATSHAATPPPTAAPPPVEAATARSSLPPDMVPVGGEAAFNAPRMAVSHTPAPPVTSAREQVLQDAHAGVKPTVGPSATPPPPAYPGPEAYAGAGQAAADVIQGPAQHSLDRLGGAVEDAAKSGPEVDFAPIKAKLEAMAAKSRPSTVGGETAGLSQADLPSDPKDRTRFLSRLKDAGVAVEENHPLPGVLSLIQNAPDTVSFEDAHRYKRLLDDATNWNSPAKGQLKQITKGVRGDLRAALSAHAPYNAATEAYQQAVPLFSKGYAKQVTQSAVNNPEAIAKIIKPDEPTKLQMLHDVLTTHAAAGGGAEEGQAAWNGVRAAVVYKNLIAPGIEKFDQSLAKFHPDTLALLTHDRDGATVIDNLKQISGAFQQAQAQGVATVGAAKAGAQTAADTAAQTKAQGALAVATKQADATATKAQVQALKKPTPTEEAFAQSSLAHTESPVQLATDVLHVGAMHGMNVFRARSMAKLLFFGPKTADLIQYAAYSPLRTQALVRAMTGPAPGMMVADLMRAWGLASEEPPMATGHASTQPPPASAATPPPGPGR